MTQPMSLRITEVFTSLQGEALTSGLPTTFIRLTGCPLRCNYCDSAYAFSGGEMATLNDLVDTVKQSGTQYVCVTGGEPLAQPNCWPLLKALCDAGFFVSLETSGAMDISDVDRRTSIVLDLKTPGSGEDHRNLLTNLSLLELKDQVKVVITDEDDFRWLEMFCSLQPRVLNSGVIWISPSFGQMSIKRLAELVIASQYPFRLQLQLHKQIWGEEIGR